jgi:hypothetical protein
MEPSLRASILSLIAQAEYACKGALSEENRKELGYPFAAGYSRSALDSIRQLVESAQ